MMHRENDWNSSVLVRLQGSLPNRTKRKLEVIVEHAIKASVNLESVAYLMKPVASALGCGGAL